MMIQYLQTLNKATTLTMLVSEAGRTHRPKLHPVTKECNT